MWESEAKPCPHEWQTAPVQRSNGTTAQFYSAPKATHKTVAPDKIPINALCVNFVMAPKLSLCNYYHV